MSQEKKKRRLPAFELQYIVTLILAAVVAFLNCGIIKECYSPFVFNDEMGYWMHAAEFAGLDWSGVSETVGWYSYGYSLLLAPLIRIFSDAVTLYRAALVLNVVMVVACYFMFVYIIRKLFPKLEVLPASAAAAAGILYTSYQFNSGIAWSETALLMAVTIVVLLMARALEKPTCLNMGCLGLFTAYMYMVHNRTVGIVASVVFVILIAVVCKKLTLKNFGLFAAVLAAGFIADRLIKAHLEKVFWSNGAEGNDADSVLGKLKGALTSGEELRKLIGVMSGQLFAITASTFCLVLFALVIMARRGAVGLYKAKKAVKGGKKLSEAADSRYLVFLFIFCAFVSTYLISSIFMLGFERIDHIIYTRYFDILSGILIMIGICFLFEAEKSDIIAAMFVPLIMRVCVGKANYMMTILSDPTFNKVCAPPLCQLFENNGINFHAYFNYAVSWFFAFMIVSCLLKWKKLSIYFCSAVCAVIFSMNTPSAREAIYVFQRNYEGDRALCDRVRELPEKTIYVTSDAGNFIAFLQYEMKDVRVELADTAEDIDGEGYLFARSEDAERFEGCQTVDNSDRLDVYLIKQKNSR